MNFLDVWPWLWWSVMVSINLVNVAMSIVVYREYRELKDTKDVKYQRWMLAMGFIFTFVGYYRSFFVTSYGRRFGWFDTILNSTGLVRTLAMFAELSFAGLIAFSMIKFNEYVPLSEKTQGKKVLKFYITKSPYILVICIFLANFCINFGVITQFSLMGAIEETLWGIGFFSILPLAFIQLIRALKIKEKDAIERLRRLRISAIIIFLWCVVYCSYSVSLHLPDYWRTQIEIITTTGYPPLETGLDAVLDIFLTVYETRAYDDWGFGFVFWHTAYFSVCVWISIFLMQAPRPLDAPRHKNSKNQTRLILFLIVTVIILLLFLILSPAFL